MNKSPALLPVNLKEAESRGIGELDVIIVTADAYVDHPSFGAALVGRFLESLGLTVGIIPQPDPDNINDFRALGRPRLFFGVTAGNLDSMVSLYTAGRKIRSDDPYSEGGVPKKRPYLPTVVYTGLLRQAFAGVPVVIGGIEASLRRISHYDYYRDKIRRSVLLDSKADMLIYGSAEAPLKNLVKRLRAGEDIRSIKELRGTAVPVNAKDFEESYAGCLRLPSHEEVSGSAEEFSRMTALVYSNANPYSARRLFQASAGRGVIINPPAFPPDTQTLDSIYALPFTGAAHPMYGGGIPALKTVEASITAHRGCYGGCSFCAISLHQGKTVRSRSPRSILCEAERLAGKGVSVISDIGGPTANMYGTFCADEKAEKKCRRRSCLYPEPCVNLKSGPENYLSVLRAAGRINGLKRVYINSGIRHDLAAAHPEFVEELARHHVQGHLSVAPEHCCREVLGLMGKPGIGKYEEFTGLFKASSSAAGKKQFIMPYFIVGHPGADEKSERALADYVKKKSIRMRQIQEFYPTPMTASTSMYCTGLDPFSGREVYSEKKTAVKKRWKGRLLKP